MSKKVLVKRTPLIINSLIAVMLGRLGMTVDESLDIYLELFERLAANLENTAESQFGSSAIIKSGILKATVSELVKKQGLPINCEFRNEDNVSCYT